MMPAPIHRDDLARYFAVKPRALARVLRDLEIRPVGRTVPWPMIWRALGLADEQDPGHFDDLMTPLLAAKAVASELGVTPSIIYRWRKGKIPPGHAPMPAAIDLSNGRAGARALRWRKSEILAWHCQKPAPAYAKARPAFGALSPTK